MAEPTEPIVVPYSRFLEYRERRRESGADVMKPLGAAIDDDEPHLPDQPSAPVSTAWRTL
jgi:hypothetical protein